MRRAVGDHPAIVQHHDMVGDFHHHAHVVFDQQDTDLLFVPDMHQKRVQGGGFTRVQTGRGLVQAQQNRLGAHGARDLEPAPLAVRKDGGVDIGVAGEFGPRQPVTGQLDRLALGIAIARQAEQPGEGICRGPHQPVVLGDDQVLQHRHLGKQAHALKCAHHARPLRDAEPIEPFELEPAVAVAKRQPAHARPVETGKAVEHRGLAGAVGADNGGDLAVAGDKRKIIDRNQAAETHGEMLDAQQPGFGHVGAGA